jgi:hypothetical protein
MNSRWDDRIYVDHLVAEHRRLDQLIRATLATLPSWEETNVEAWLPRMVEGLTAIRQEIAHHFLEEEQGGCLEEAVAYCPSLSDEVIHIEAEHPTLLADLDELIERARSLKEPTTRDGHVLGQELRAIARKLRAHEAHENRIVGRGFGVCIET